MSIILSKKNNEAMDVISCKRCLYTSTHPFGILFDREGVCSGCRVHDEKDKLDWSYRQHELMKIVSEYRSNSNYDCIVPITGGQDSFFTLHYVINVLKLKPLTVNFNRITNTSTGIANLSRLRSVFGVDLHQITIAESLAKSVIKTTLENLGTINWLWIAGQTATAVQVARDMKVPLVIWGAHQGIEQVGMYSHLDGVEMNRRYRLEHDLLGFDENRIMEFDCDFGFHELDSIKYVTDDEILSTGIRGLYLSNYVRWDPRAQHQLVSKYYGYKGKKTPRTFYKYDNPDCEIYTGFQDEMKHLKFGYSKVTDQLCREIRHGRIKRNLAQVINHIYQRKSDKSANTRFASWLGIQPTVLDLVKIRHSRNFINSVHDYDDTFQHGRNSLQEKPFKYEIFGKGLKPLSHDN